MKSVLGKRGARKITSALGANSPGESTLIVAYEYLEIPLEKVFVQSVGFSLPSYNH